MTSDPKPDLQLGRKVYVCLEPPVCHGREVLSADESCDVQLRNEQRCSCKTNYVAVYVAGRGRVMRTFGEHVCVFVVGLDSESVRVVDE